MHHTSTDIQNRCYQLSVSFRAIGLRNFWTSFCHEISVALGDWNVKISNQGDFMDTFRGPSWKGGKRVVLLIDDFNMLFQAEDDNRNDVLQGLRALECPPSCVISSLSTVLAGTFSIVHMSPTSRHIAPFNVVSETFQNPNFNKEEIENLFRDFAQDSGITIDTDVISDIWEKTNGCVDILPGICTTLSHISPQSSSHGLHLWPFHLE
jgi:hypothetical protein